MAKQFRLGGRVVEFADNMPHYLISDMLAKLAEIQIYDERRIKELKEQAFGLREDFEAFLADVLLVSLSAGEGADPLEMLLSQEQQQSLLNALDALRAIELKPKEQLPGG